MQQLTFSVTLLQTASNKGLRSSALTTSSQTPFTFTNCKPLVSTSCLAFEPFVSFIFTNLEKLYWLWLAMINLFWVSNKSTFSLSQIFRFLNSFLIFFFLFTAAPAAYGSSQAGSPTGAAAEASATATAILDPSHICNLHHSLQQCQILNPLSKARDQTHILTETMLGP